MHQYLIYNIGCSDLRKITYSCILTCLFIADLNVRGRENFNQKTMQINTGTQTLKLYTPPVPDAGQVPLEEIPGKTTGDGMGRPLSEYTSFGGIPARAPSPPVTCQKTERTSSKSILGFRLKGQSPVETPSCLEMGLMSMWTVVDIFLILSLLAGYWHCSLSLIRINIMYN